MMADALELKKRALELELELAESRQAQGQMTHSAAAEDPFPKGRWQELGATALAGPYKGLGLLADTLLGGITERVEDAVNLGRRFGDIGSKAMGGEGMPPIQLERFPSLGKRGQDLENRWAGFSSTKELLDPAYRGKAPAEDDYTRAATSAASGSLLYPGGPVTNVASSIASSVTDKALQQSGAGDKTRLLASLLAGLGTSTAMGYGNRFLANRFDMPLGGTARVTHALDRSDPAAIQEAIRKQAEMSQRGIQVLPSQATGGSTPGLTQLEGEVLLSKGKSGQGVRDIVFKQAQQMDDLARQVVDDMPGVVAPEGRAASDLVQAAKKRLLAEKEARQSVTALDYEAGKQSIKPIPQDTLKGIREELRAAQKAAPAASLEASHLANLQRKYEAVLRASGGRPRPVDLWQLNKDFVESLDNPQNFTASSLKETLRKTSERVLMKAAEESSPRLERARSVAAALRDRNPVRLDPLTKLSGSTDATASLRQILQNTDPIAQIASGVPAWKNDLAQMRRVGSEVLGADLPAAQTGLKTAVEMARQRAFQLDAAGMRPSAAGARFAGEVVGLPAQRQALANALKTVGADAPKITTTLDDITALSRPTAISGAHDIGTGIAGMDVLKAGSPHGLQAAQGRMNIIRNSVNAMSNRTIAKLLERPDSLAEMQRIAGAQTLEPRALLTIILARQAQAQNQLAPQE